MSLESSKRTLNKASERDIEAYKKWLNMDEATARLPWFSKQNAANWIVLDKWQEYQMDIRRQLAQSSASGKKSSPSLAHAAASSILHRPQKKQGARRTPMLQTIQAHRTNFSLPNGKHTQPESAMNQPEIIEISSESEEELSCQLRKRAPSESIYGDQPKKKRATEVIELLDSDDETAVVVKREDIHPSAVPPSTQSIVAIIKKEASIPVSEGIESSPKNAMPNDTKSNSQLVIDETAKDQSGKYILSKKVRVDEVKVLSEVPKRWPIPPEDTAIAYVVNLSEDKKWKEAKGKIKNIDSFLKQEDQDSWGQGTNGTTTKPTPIQILGNLATRRSVHTCNGGRRCELFDENLLHGYVRDDAEDMMATQKIFLAAQKQNQLDGATIIGLTEVFYRLIQGMKCKKSLCDGKAVLISLKKGPSIQGKNHFVGCSKWRKGEDFQHLYSPIPSEVDETILFQFFNNTSIISKDIEKYKSPCSAFRHPRHGKQKKCTYTHFRDGRPYFANMVQHECEVKKIVYTSLDPNRPIVIVIFEGRHTHPPWPEEKPSEEAKVDLQKCLDAFGIYGVTAEKLDAAPSTIALLGMPLSAKHGSFRNKRTLQDTLRDKKKEECPDMDWTGVFNKYNEDQKNLKPEDQYIWALRMEGNIKFVVTAHPVLATLIHEARFLVCDYTFKRTHGELNEWEVAIWWGAGNERITAARAYCNSATHEAFDYVWEGFFTAVERATGKKIKFKVFDKSGNILCIILDMEAPQVQGLGTTIIRLGLNDPSVSKIMEQDPNIIVQYLLKLCFVHWGRNTEKLVPIVGRTVVDYLNRFPILENKADIENWKNFCTNHPSKSLRDWYGHKDSYAWLLPGFNCTLSRMPLEFWNSTPNHSNLVETAHVSTNYSTGIGLSPLEAIELARRYDNQKAASVIAASQTCIPRNINNSSKARMSRNLGRQSHRAEHTQTHLKIDHEISNLKAQLGNSTKQTNNLKAQLKSLADKKKEAGKSPRHSQAPMNRFNVPIPKIQALSIFEELQASSLSDSSPPPTQSQRVNNDMDFLTGPSTSMAPISQLQDNHHIHTEASMESADFEMNIAHPIAAFDGRFGLQYEKAFEPPPFDYQTFTEMLENEPIPALTAAELEAHCFLRQAKGI